MKYLNRIILFCLIVAPGILTFSQQTGKVSAWDNSTVAYRHPSVETMEAYRQMDIYKYDRYEMPESLWDKFIKWFFGLFADMGIQPNTIKYLIIGTGVLILIFIILKLIGIRPSGIFIISASKPVSQLNFAQGSDDIHNQNLDNMLQVSIRNKAHREAVRILYLLCLRQLHHENKIDWQPWKTNLDYYYELKAKKNRQEFKQLVLNYEYVWYGQFAMDESKFLAIKTQFDHFNDCMTPKSNKHE